MRRTCARFLALAAIVAVGCKKPEPPPPPPPPPPTPTVRVQVISVDPPSVMVHEPFRAQVFGSGFQTDVGVWVGSTQIAAVTRFDSNSIEISVPPLEQGAHDVRVLNPDGTGHTLKSAIFARIIDTTRTDPTAGLSCDNLTINFDFDSSSLSSRAQAALSTNLACFTQRTGTVRVEGHCDERGTTDYNLALGQRRADSVRRWLASQGVPSSRVQTISYGEERPTDRSGGEASWARNRRAEVQAQK